DRLACNKRRAHDHTREVFKSFRTIALANEISGGCGRRPGLPTHVGWRQGLTSGKVCFGHKNIDGVELWRLDFRRRRLVGTASQQCGDATCSQRDGQNYDTCSFHTLTLTMTWRPAGRVNQIAASAAAASAMPYGTSPALSCRRMIQAWRVSTPGKGSLRNCSRTSVSTPPKIDAYSR